MRHNLKLPFMGIIKAGDVHGDDEGFMWPDSRSWPFWSSILESSRGASPYEGALGNYVLGMRSMEFSIERNGGKFVGYENTLENSLSKGIMSVGFGLDKLLGFTG